MKGVLGTLRPRTVHCEAASVVLCFYIAVCSRFLLSFFFFFRVGDKVGPLHTKLHDIHESLSRDFEEIVVEASACN